MTEQQNASNNPLLKPFSLPPFSAIKPEHIVPAMQSAIEESRQTIERVVAQGAPYTWENLCQPLAESDDRLSRIWSPVGHLNAVKNSPELREAYEQCLPILSEFSTWTGQHAGLYQAYRDLKDSEHFTTLSVAQKKRLITRCVISSYPALVCRSTNRNATAKFRRVCLSWVRRTATTCSMPRWAGAS